MIDDAAARSATFSGGRLTILGSKVAKADRGHAEATPIDVTFLQGPVVEIRSGKVIGRSGTSTIRVTYRVWNRWNESQWHIVDLKQVVNR